MDRRVRKERKVRPGFTPVEDVVRYRPARAREAEEARKRGVPGSAAQTKASTSSTSPSSTVSSPSASLSGSTEAVPPTRHSSVARSSTIPSAASNGSNNGEQPRGKFAPLEPPRQRKGAGAPAATNITAAGRPDKQADELPKPWRNSRLRKPAAPAAAQNEAADVPIALHGEKTDRSGKADEKSKDETHTVLDRQPQVAGDELVAQLEDLRIGQSKEPSQNRG
ncbi:hypothetical protein PHSY_005978 [Pseudozyma hubeiensis SY62]|uniref:WIBG Mago-binding domain-containing protein n=1 Tax=Pseudozyma hubeiensis (strain SY62) TaxID=1305764 RepID=R9PAM3_PSEHS|nr:hypothetical protein PHSY_005978 [Pseudozyma hubeiensis SY62]GAC98384.1 hypothetical protein PHSY_005978 [Pseudozyma hubeiensis SY62]